jgi:hypothetical protein
LSSSDWESEIERIYAHLRSCANGVTVLVQQHSGPVAVFCLPPRPVEQPADEEQPEDLEEMDAALLAVVTIDVQTAKVLIARAGYSYGQHTLAAIRRLVDADLIRRKNGGICLP